jgi:CelD/BcsL family acetyltransferase involved in cellulose biosynthesis
MRRNAVPARPYRFFKTLWDLLKPEDGLTLLLAEHWGAGHARMLAGSLFLLSGSTVSYAFNGSRRRDLTLRPNDLIQWHAINDACNRGFQTFDFGEVGDERSDLAVFKQKWGAEPVRMYRYYYPGLPAENGLAISFMGSFKARLGKTLRR